MSTRKNARLTGQQRRKQRVRKKVTGAPERPRLSVFRSAKHMFVQVIDDVADNTLVSAGTHGKSGVGDDNMSKVEQARAIGKAIADKCRSQNITAVVFDRNGNRYHGRVKAVAEGAREGGLRF